MLVSTRRSSKWFFVVVAGLSPLLLMSTSGGGSASFYVLLAISVGILAAERHAPWTPLRQYGPLAAAFSIPLVAVLANQAWHQSWHSSDFEKALRFLLAMLVLAAAVRIPRQQLRHAFVGILAATWYAAIEIARLAYTSHARPTTKEFNAVSYGDFTLLFATISAYSLGFQLTRHRRLEAAVKLATALAGLGGYILTQTRGGWLAVPFFVLIAVIAAGGMAMRYKLLSVATLLAAAALIMHADQSLRSRIDIGMAQYRNCATSPLDDNSICIRLQLWHSAWGMFKAEPLVGVGGGDRFRERLRTLHEEGKVSAFVATRFGETHNDVLFFLATYGLPGGLGILAIYAVPGWYFARRLSSQDALRRTAAAAGLALCVGFAVFGMTEMMFRGMRTAALYAAWIAIFMALSHPGADDSTTSS